MEDRARDGAGLTVRAGGPDDRGFVVALGAAAFAAFGDYAPIMRSFLDSPDVAIWIAEGERGPAGFALVETDARLPGLADLEAIAVDPHQRRQGVATALLQRVIASCREGRRGSALLVLTVAEDNEPAIALFERAGFEMVPGLIGRYAGGQRSRRMAKALTPARQP